LGFKEVRLLKSEVFCTVFLFSMYVASNLGARFGFFSFSYVFSLLAYSMVVTFVLYWLEERPEAHTLIMEPEDKKKAILI